MIVNRVNLGSVSTLVHLCILHAATTAGDSDDLIAPT